VMLEKEMNAEYSLLVLIGLVCVNDVIAQSCKAGNHHLLTMSIHLFIYSLNIFCERIIPTTYDHIVDN